jgi:nucleoside-diphosphate-sugar epimerase
MLKALVLGASGGMGFAIVEELDERNIEVVAFARNKNRLEQLFDGNENVSIFAGDVFEKEELYEAAKGVDIIFHAINIPYHEWSEKQPTIMRNVVITAEKVGAKLAIVDNIYAYGDPGITKITESTDKKPHTKKGKIRLELEKIAKQAKTPVLIAHFPDFYGPNALNTYFHYTFKSMVDNKKAMFVGNQKLPREFIYTRDGAKAMVELAMHNTAYGQNWNIPGADLITGEEAIDIAKEYLNYSQKVSTATKTMIKFVGIFDKQMRELVEMLYLTEKTVALSGEKYEEEIGELPRTPYKEGIKNTLAYMKA